MGQARRFCTQCGHQRVVGRYCTNCGARTDPTAPEPTSPEPTSPEPTRPFREQGSPTPSEVGSYPGAPLASRRNVLPWLVGSLLVLAVVGVVTGLLVAGSVDEPDLPAVSDRGVPSPDSDLDAGPERDIDSGPEGIAGTGTLQPAAVTVPRTAPGSVDGAGNPVSFRAANLLDDDPRTGWRMPGDGTGSVITLTFDQPVTVTEVGLINGYAKTDPPHDWYAGNRRIETVTWTFDDGTAVTQRLDRARKLQTVPVRAGPTTTIRLRLVAVTAPGTGPDRRDFTAISDLQVVGTR